MPAWRFNEEITSRYAIKYRWDSEKLKAVLRDFGSLPEEGQEGLFSDLARAFGRFGLFRPNVRAIPANATAKRIQDIATNSRKLLSAVGINVSRVDWDLFSEPFAARPATERLQFLYRRLEEGSEFRHDGEETLLFLSSARTDTNRRDDPVGLEAIRTEIRKAHETIAETIVGLTWLHRQAKAAADSIESRRKKGSGGAENRQTAKGLLIRDAIEIWADVRKEYPDANGNCEIGLGGPLRRFVRSVATLFGTEVTDDQIDNSWRDRLGRNQKRK